jgi:hypothetical protein
VHDVGPVLGDGRGEAAAGQGDTDLGIARERKGGDTDDGARPARAVLAGATTSGR